MDVLYNYLINVGCIAEHASVAVCCVAVISVYALYRTLIGLISPK